MASKEFEMFSSQADKLVAQGRLEEALDMYQRALQIEPHNAVVRHNVINIYMKGGEFEATVAEYLAWAKVCQERGMVDDALAVYQELINLEHQAAKKSFLMGQRGAVGDIVKELVNSVRVEIFYNVGVLLQAKGHFDDSIEYLKACLELAPPESSARIHMVLGQAFMKKGMDKEAVGEFQEVVRLAPMDSAYAYEMLGEIYIRGGRTPQGTIVWFRNAGDLYIKNNQILDAIRVFERILNFEPKNKDVLGRLGEIYSQRGQMDKATEVCLKLAGIYSEEGFLDKVVVLYEKLLEWVPENGEIRRKLISIYKEILNVDSGNLSARHKLIGLLLNDGSAEEAIPEFLLLAGTYLEKGMLKEGISVCEKMLDIDPENVKANELLGEIYFRQGDTDVALDQFLHVVKLLREQGNDEEASNLNKELVKKFPQQIELYYQQAIEEKERGNFESAIKILDSIIKDNPSYKQAMFAKADIVQKMDRWDEAFGIYKEILKLEPNHIEVRKILLEKYISDSNLDEALEETKLIAEQLFAKGDYKEIETLYKRILAFLPDNTDVRERICEVQTARGHIEKAISGYLVILNVYRRFELFDNAVKICNKILELSPENLFAKRTEASLYRNINPQEAINKYAKLAELYISKTLDLQAGEIISEILNIDSSARSYRQKLIDIFVKKLKFEDAVSHYRILLMDYLQEGEIQSAKDIVKELIALQPLNLALREEICAIYLEYDLLPEAMALLGELVHLYSDKEDSDKVIEITLKLSELSASQGKHSLSWDYAIKVAEAYYKKGDTDLALDEFTIVLRKMLEYDEFERQALVFARMEEIYFAEDRIDSAIISFEKIVKEFVESGKIEKGLVLQEQIEKIYEKKGDFDKAVEILEFISAQYEELGNYSESLRMKEAISVIWISKDRVDDLIENYFSMIDLLLRQGLPSEAYELFDKIEQYQPDNHEYLKRMADTMFTGGFIGESQPLFDKLLLKESDSYAIMSKLAIIHAVKAEYDKACEYVRKVLPFGFLGELVSDYRSYVFDNFEEGKARIKMGRFYEETSFYEEAVFEYNMAASMPSSTLPGFNALGNMFLKQGFFELAVKQFKNILELDVSDEELLDTRYNLATAYEGQGFFEDALNLYQECYAIDIRYKDVAEKIAVVSGKLG